MNETQFRQMLKNRVRPGVRRLFDTPASGRVLRGAARDVRRRDAARAVLERVLPAKWLGDVVVDAVQDGRVVLSVANAATAERIRRQESKLVKEIASRVSGVVRLDVRRDWTAEGGNRRAEDE